MDAEKSGSSTDKRSRSGCCKSSEPLCSTVRLQRNQAEKQRRDRLNGYISELANIVPMVKNSSKPVDKVSVLRLAAAHMRLNFSCLNHKKFNSKIPALPSSINSYLETVEKNIGGFIVATTVTGMVLFCSKCIEDFVGYQCIDLIGQSIYNYVDPKEVNFFEKKINSAVSRGKKEKNATKVIKLHMQQRPLPRSTEVRYRKMLFKLSVHSNDAFNDPLSPSKSPQKCKKVKHKDFGASSVVLIFVEPMKMEPKINRAYLLTHQDIYFTIHGLQGEIMYADQRIATITGYMPHDVQGTSAYQYILDSDVPIALFAQKAMFTSNDGTGLITYRLKIFDSTYIYLQSKGQIVYKDNSTEMSHFVCYNKWLSEEEGNRELIKFQERFAPQITDSKAAEIPEKSSNNQSLQLKSPQQNEDTFGNLKTANKLNCMKGTSTVIYSGNALPEYEPFRKSDHTENSSNTQSTSSVQSLNGCSKSKNRKLFLNGKISENYLVQSCTSDLNDDAKKTSSCNVDEYEQETSRDEDNTYSSEAQLIEHPVPTLQTSNSTFNQLCFTDKSELLNVSKNLNGMKGFSLTLFQSQDINQTECAYLPQLNSGEIANPSVESGENCIQVSNVPPEMHNRRPSLVDELSSFTQLYGSVQEPVNGFCISKEKLPNVVNAIVSEKEATELNPVIKPTINENTSIYTNEFCNSRYATPRYESNGHYNMHSSYTSPKNCSYQNFASNKFENDASFAALNGAPLHINGTNFDSASLFSASFGTSHNAPLYCNGTGFPIPNGHSPYTNGDVYSRTNGYSVSNKSSLTMSGSSHTEVQKQIVTKNKQTSNTNDAHLNPMYAIPAKRIKTDLVSGSTDNRNGDAHIFNLLDDNDLFPEIDLNNGDGNLFQGIKASSLVGESTPIQRDSGSVNFNGELYNELDMFFKQLPMSRCTPQSQLSYELAQSVDCDKPQLSLPSLSSRNASS